MNKKSMFKTLSSGIDQLIAQGMPAKRSDFVLYFDKETQTTIFGLTLPHFVRQTDSVYDNHLHIEFSKARGNEKQYQLDAVKFFLMQYFDQAADIVSDAQQNIDFENSDLEVRQNLAQDAIYVLKKYLAWKDFLPNDLDEQTQPIVMASFKDAVKRHYFSATNFTKVKQYGPFFGSYFGNLLPIISDPDVNLDTVFEKFDKMKTPLLTPQTVPSGFAKESFCQQPWFI